VLCVHAATAYGDAIAILAAGKKWDINQRATDTDHQIGECPDHGAEGHRSAPGSEELSWSKELPRTRLLQVGTGFIKDRRSPQP
jgi:hypothetical protein